MTVTEQAAPAAPAGPGAAEDDDTEWVPTSWEFQDQPPTTEDVLDKLETLSPWFGGVDPKKYLEFVQPLPQRKKTSKKGEPEVWKDVWTLYVTVAGRITMINDAAWRNGWMVNFVPEPDVPEGNPAGFVVMDDERIVYREYAEIWRHARPEFNETGEQIGLEWLAEPIMLGRKPGTAWVPATGGAGAVQSNRYEKVETSARGRAIAGWGIGVLPGSGVASLDEMRDAASLGRAETETQGGRRRRRQAPSREGMEEELRETLVAYQQETGFELEAVDEKVKAFVMSSFGKEVGRSEGGPFDLTSLKDGEIGLLLNQMRKGLAKAQQENAERDKERL